MSMENNLDYLAGQVLSLLFYVITLVIYNRARKEYIGGKIATAIKLVMGFLCIRLLADFTDYFAGMCLPINPDTVLIIKIVLNLSAMCVLFFGGLRFFVTRPATRVPASRPPAPAPARPAGKKQPDAGPAPPTLDAAAGSATVVLEDAVGEPADSLEDRPALGRYEILGQIGKGAMGVVYKGRDSKLQRITAIKTIRFGDDFDEDQVDDIKKQFYREAELVAKLSHPNIVAIYDVGEDLDLSYLAMEYLDGESLERYTRKENSLPVGQCIQVLIQVCEALAYAHSQDIVHRDIKPANIMLLKNGTVKVTDFGVARSMVGSQTRTGVVKGTPYYMSPEQARGEKVTGVSDIFSLGVVFYQLLTGRLPFTGENLAAIMYQTMSADPVPASKFNDRVDKTTLAVLNRALEKDKHKRYQDAAKMADHLRVLSRYRGEEAGAVSPGPAKPVRKSAPAARPASIQAHKVQTKPRRAVDSPPPRDVPHPKPGTDGGAAKTKAAVLKRSSPWRRRIVLVVGACLLISIPSFYLWYKSRAIALKETNFAAYRVQKKGKPKKVAPPAISEVAKDDASGPLTPEAARQEKEQARLAREAAEKKEQARIAREAAEKREQARLAREAAEKREQARLAREAAEKREQARIAREAAEKKEQERLAEIARQQTLRQAAEMATIEQMIAAAKIKLARREYRDAAAGYQKALAILSASEFNAHEQYQQLRGVVTTALQADAIVYGARGYVLYKNKWYSPEDYKKQLLAEGFVTYKGDFVLYKTLRPVIEDLAEREVRVFLRKKFTGQQVHKKQIDLHALSLKQNTLPQSSYEVLFNWEIWTFNDITNGRCAVEVLYNAEKDKWKTMPVKIE